MFFVEKLCQITVFLNNGDRDVVEDGEGDPKYEEIQRQERLGSLKNLDSGKGDD